MVNLHTQGYPLVIMDWVTFAITTPFVVARLYVQLWFRSKPWRELWIIGAYFLYLGCTIDDSLLNGWNWFNDDVSYSDRTDAQVAPYYKAQFTWSLFYSQIMYCCKAALLCFYTDIAPRTAFPKTWWLIVFTWVCTLLGAANYFLFQLLQCGTHISINWTQSEQTWDTTTCTTYQPEWFIAASAHHVFTDFLVFCIPFIIIHHLDLDRSQKKGVYAMFALGIINVLCAVSSLVYNVALETVFYNQSHSWSPQVWFNFDQAFTYLLPFQAGTAIIIACMPYCRRLWKGTKAKYLRSELATDNLAAVHAAVGESLTITGTKSLDIAVTHNGHSADTTVTNV